MAFILIVEDEQLLRWGIRRQLEQQGHTVHEAGTLAEAMLHLNDHRPEIVILDVRLPDGSGIDLLAEQRIALSESLVIVSTASGQVDHAVRAMKLGAFDFLSKPVPEDELLRVVALAVARLAEKTSLEAAQREREQATDRQVVVFSRVMREFLDLAETVAASPTLSVLVQGETGTGKEVFARFVHFRSARSRGPLVAINCAALAPTLVESELFGHEKGAFTDAKATRKGIFELAQGGTVILDEVTELAPSTQAKLLRFLEERCLRRVGGSREIPIDVRVVALSNRGLEEAVAAGDFRRDLYFRLNVVPLHIPPLRAHREDIVPLAMHFLRQFGSHCGKHFDGLHPDLEAALLAHDWPGNVRELRNLMERASILERGGLITGRHLPIGRPAGAPGLAAPAEEELVTLDEGEFRLIVRAMRSTGGNQSKAARLLGVTRDQIRYRVKRYRDEGRWTPDVPIDDVD